MGWESRPTTSQAIISPWQKHSVLLQPNSWGLTSFQACGPACLSGLTSTQLDLVFDLASFFLQLFPF